MEQRVGNIDDSNFSPPGEQNQLGFAHLADGPKFIHFVLVAFSHGFRPDMTGALTGMRAAFARTKDYTIPYPIPWCSHCSGDHCHALPWMIHGG
jgi:hypothetical protein